MRSWVEGSWSSDIFSLGCVMAEMFTGGQELFDLTSLLRYRNDPSSLPANTLHRIEDEHVKVVLIMGSHVGTHYEYDFSQ